MTEFKLHPPVLRLVVQSLEEIFSQGRYADKVIERVSKTAKVRLGARDRRLLAESVYDIVRWWRTLWVVVHGHPFPEAQALGPKEFWPIVGAWLVLFKGFEQLPPWPEWAGQPLPKELKDRFQNLSEADRSSFPEWINQLGADQLGESRWLQMREVLNQQAPVFLRVNRLKCSRQELQDRLSQEGIETLAVEGVDSALKLSQRAPVFRTEAFKLGWFEVQDLGSQHIAPFLEVKPQHRVVDACAGAGGKSLHLAELMQNKGRILAMDVHQWKLNELRTRARRAGVDLIETRLIDSTKIIKRLRGQVDRLLLDVPCSGLGVIRRNPDSKWKLQPAEVKRLEEVQAQLLNDYSQMVKTGGKMVYATCSLLPSENQRQVEVFLSHPKGSQWQLEEELILDPVSDGGDGFYAARLVRRGDSTT